MKWVIARYVNGITLNGKEYVLEKKDGDIKRFDSHTEAKEFYIKAGGDIADLGYSVFTEQKD